MSNLNSKFDVVRGWPGTSAVDEYFQVNSGTVVEGQLVILDTTTGKVKPPAAIAAQTGTTPTALRMVIQGNDQWDGSFTTRVVTLRGAFTVQTDQFVAGAYTPGQLVTVDVSAHPGQITARTGALEQVVGEVEAYDSVNSILTVSMTI